MRYSAVIFDLDGTMTDSAPGIIAGIRHALKKMNWQVPEEAVLRKFLGPPLVASFMRYCGMTEAQAVEATGIYRELYLTLGCTENRVYPGIRPLLSALKRQGVYMGVATGKGQEQTERILHHFNLWHYFDAVCGPLPGDYHADKRDLITRAMKGHPGPAIMIGDRDSDILAAKALGMDSVAVLYGYGSHEEMTGCGATALAESTEALWQAIGLEKPEPERGPFITLEGNDGSGKSTQARMLSERLKGCGYDVLSTREPGGTQVSEKIRQILLDKENSKLHNVTEAMLYAAARAQHVREVILPALREGRLVLSDRYVDSSIAYQGAGRQLGMDLVREINRPAIDGCLPDLTILLEMDPETALKRRATAFQMDRMELLGDGFHQRVAEAFQQMQKAEPERIKRVDASGSPEEVAKAIADIALERLRVMESG